MVICCQFTDIDNEWFLYTLFIRIWNRKNLQTVCVILLHLPSYIVALLIKDWSNLSQHTDCETDTHGPDDVSCVFDLCTYLQYWCSDEFVLSVQKNKTCFIWTECDFFFYLHPLSQNAAVGTAPLPVSRWQASLTACFWMWPVKSPSVNVELNLTSLNDGSIIQKHTRD